jgi:hypothetical protein
MASQNKFPAIEAHMVTTNKAQLMAAIKAVPFNADTSTVIEAVNDRNELLCRYKFPPGYKRFGLAYAHDAHLRRIARNVSKTPASMWR